MPNSFFERLLKTIDPEGTAYHGTRFGDAIKQQGFKEPTKIGNFGKGIYSSPNKQVAELYSEAIRGLKRNQLKMKPQVLEGRLPFGTRLFDMKNETKLGNIKSKPELTRKIKALGYDGIKSQGETVLFDRRVANSTFRVGPHSARRLPKVNSGPYLALFELILNDVLSTKAADATLNSNFKYSKPGPYGPAP